MDHAPIATTTSTTPLLAPPPVIQIVSFSDVATSTPGRRRNSLAILFVSLLLILGLLSAGDGQEEYRSEQMINSSFDQSNHTLDQDRTPIGKLTSAGVVFSSWSESSVYVEVSHFIHIRSGRRERERLIPTACTANKFNSSLSTFSVRSSSHQRSA